MLPRPVLIRKTSANRCRPHLPLLGCFHPGTCIVPSPSSSREERFTRRPPYQPPQLGISLCSRTLGRKDSHLSSASIIVISPPLRSITCRRIFTILCTIPPHLLLSRTSLRMMNDHPLAIPVLVRITTNGTLTLARPLLQASRRGLGRPRLISGIFGV
jgi:hypothetical protein